MTMANPEKILRDLIDRIIDKKTYIDYSVDIKPITSGGANYTSALYNGIVTAPKCEDVEFFAKVGIVGEKLRAGMNADLMYSTEMFVYTKLIKIYKNLEEKYEIPDEERFVFPKFYGCNPNFGEETVILENLVSKGYRTVNRFDSMDWEHAAKAVEVLAKFHALSFAYEKEHPEEFRKTAESKKFQDVERDNCVMEIWKSMMRRAIQVTKEEHKVKLANFLETQSEKYAFYQNPLRKIVLIHGDYRLSNLLFKKQGNKLQGVLVDYQTVHSGCPVSDLLYFIFLGSDREFRKKHYNELLDHYYSQLSTALQRFHIDADEVYCKETFTNELKEMLPYALLLGVVVLPIVTVGTDSAPKVDGEADLSQFVMKPNELYAKRFNEIVSEFVDWGIL